MKKNLLNGFEFKKFECINNGLMLPVDNNTFLSEKTNKKQQLVYDYFSKSKLVKLSVEQLQRIIETIEGTEFNTMKDVKIQIDSWTAIRLKDYEIRDLEKQLLAT